VLSQVADLVELFETCIAELRTARGESQDHLAYCARNGLPVDVPVVTRLMDDAQHAELRIINERRMLRNAPISQAATMLSAGEAVLRFGTATLAYVRNALEWCASSYAQAHATQFFDARAQGSQDMNYDRNGTQASVRRVERQLLDVLDLSSEEFGLSVTSSGMAAFTLVESFLVRDRLRPGDVVVVAPYVYYEGWQQLGALPFIRLEQASGYGVEDIVSDVLTHRPRCLFVDPVANNSRQRMVDLPALFRRLREVVTERLTVVVDGTMVGGALPAALLAGDDKLEIIYNESCTKYLQLGMDATQAGLVVYPVELAERFDELRRNGGAVLYRNNAELFPRYDRALLRRRMRRICGNAERLAHLLRDDPRVSAVAETYHPALADHPDVRIARSLPYASGVITFLYHDNDRNDRVLLDSVIDDMIRHATESGVQLTKGVSFGYSVPRLWVQEITDDDPWFLRLNVGDRGHQLELLADVIAKGVTGQH
jgi:cystathionine gamma-synthase